MDVKHFKTSGGVAPMGSMHSTGKSDPAVIGYAGTAHGSGYEHWVEEICRKLVKTDSVPLNDGPVRYNVSMAALPQVRIAALEATSVKYVAKADSEPRLFLQMPVRTPVRVARKNQTLDIGEGGLGLTDAADPGAETTVQADGSFKTIGIERAALLAICPNAEALVAQPLDVPAHLMTLIHGYHDLALRTAGALDPAAQRLMGQHLIDLVSLVLGAARDTSELAAGRGLAAARLAAAKSDILARLAEPQLSVADVAARQGVTPRYLHMLFELEGMTFTEYVQHHRLAQAHRMLCDRRYCHRAIHAIAFDVGFNDLSYFNRCFRRRYGMTPSAVRAEAAPVVQ